MRSLLSRVLGVAAKLCAVLTACAGCTKSHPEPEKPTEIHWHGPGTDYTATTVVPEEGKEQP